jgi:internalin A
VFNPIDSTEFNTAGTRPLGLSGIVAIVLLVCGNLFPREANSQEQPQRPANRTYPWQSWPDVVRLSDRFGIVVLGDDSGPTRVVARRRSRGHYDRLNDQELACLANWPSLLRVHIRYDDVPATMLQHLRPCTKLECLDFITWDKSGFDGRDIEPLEGMKNLRDLTLVGRHMSLDAMKHIGRLGSLEDLCFTCGREGMPVTDDGLVYLRGLKRLRALELSGTRVTDKGMKYLMPLKELRDLGLLYTPVRQSDVRELVRSLPKLRIGGDGWDVPRVGDEDDPFLAEAYRTMPDVLRLSRLGVRIEVHVGPTVVTVYMDDCDLNDRDLACLAKWPLRWVTLAGKNLSAAVLQHLRSDAHLQCLGLHLVNRGFEARDIEPLEGKKYLRYLCLEGNSMPPSVMHRISRLTSVYILDLTGCPVTDDGLVHLVDLNPLKLSLAGSKVTASGLKHLMPLERLRCLDLTKTAVTKDDAQQLHRALPALNIYGGTGDATWVVEGAIAERDAKKK